MKKRTALFKVLKNRLTKFVNATDFFIIMWLAFTVVGTIIGFNIFKPEPIPLTQDEIEYYTSQAELGYYKGIVYLDDNIMFIPTSSTTAKVYTDGQPYEKQKIEVTYFKKEIVKVELYYDFTLKDAMFGAYCGLGIGFSSFPIISIFIAWITTKITFYSGRNGRKIGGSKFSNR